jgi:hypothetical protein
MLGVNNQNTWILYAITIIFYMLTVIAALNTVMHTVTMIVDLIKNKKENKNEMKLIRIQVCFIKYDTNNSLITSYKTYSAKNLNTCVQFAIAHATEFNYKIKSIELLTTEE